MVSSGSTYLNSDARFAAPISLWRQRAHGRVPGFRDITRIDATAGVDVELESLLRRNRNGPVSDRGDIARVGSTGRVHIAEHQHDALVPFLGASASVRWNSVVAVKI